MNNIEKYPKCHMRTSLGNCDPIGGFCTSVNKAICEALHKVAEPKTGKWIKATGMMPPEFHGHHCCSECGNFANMEPPFGNREDLSKFCPNCGAKMVREDGE